MSVTLNQTLAGISYRILHNGSGKESFGVDGTVGAVALVYLCAWTDRLVFRKNLVGDVYQDGSGNVIVTPAHTHPEYSYLYGQNVEFEPCGKPTGATSWQYAKCTVTYKPRSSNSSNPDDLREDAVELCGDVAETEGSDWIVSTGEPSAGKTVPTSHRVSRPIPTKNVTITFYKAGALPSSAVDALYGKLNSGTVTIATKSYGIGQALYGGYSASRKTTTAGATNWQIVHHFLCSPVDQRKEWVYGKFQLIENSAGEKKFDVASFAAIGNIS